MKNRIRQLDLIRVTSTLGIFTFHFFVNRSSTFCNVGVHGGYTGGVFVAVFFMLSGFCLSLTTKTIKKDYFLKRALTIYPAFWIAYMFYYMERVFYTGELFWDKTCGNATVIQSILGFDGLLSIHGVKNYYLIGEWFLGAILLLYILFPILNEIIKKTPIGFGIIIYSLFLIMLLIYKKFPSAFLVGTDYNFITCLESFGTGMLLKCIFEKYKNKVIYIVLGIISICGGLTIPNGTVCNFLVALGIFIIMYYATEQVLECNYIYKFILFLSNISFPFFLIHHMMIIENNAIFEKSHKLAYMFVLIFTCVYAWCLQQVSDKFGERIKELFERKAHNYSDANME